MKQEFDYDASKGEWGAHHSYFNQPQYFKSPVEEAVEFDFDGFSQVVSSLLECFNSFLSGSFIFPTDMDSQSRFATRIQIDPAEISLLLSIFSGNLQTHPITKKSSLQHAVRWFATLIHLSSCVHLSSTGHFRMRSKTSSFPS